MGQYCRIQNLCTTTTKYIWMMITIARYVWDIAWVSKETQEGNSHRCCIWVTYQFLNRQVLRPGTWDFLLDSVSCVVGWMIFGNFYIRSTRSFKDKLIWRLGRGTKWGTQNRVKYAWYQKNKGTLLSQLFMKFVKMQSYFNFVHVLGSFEANQIMAV